MLTQELRDLFMQRPFRPFAIHLSGGQVMVVDRPGSMSIAHDERRINVFTPDGHFHLMDVSDIVELEVA